jgi:hypothetical protein
MQVPDRVDVDTLNGTENPSDPGFCCHIYGTATQGLGTGWFRFEVPEPQDPEDIFSSVRIDTCRTTADDGGDSLIQVFSVADPDRGICDDGAACSVSAGDCDDGSRCDVDQAAICASLIPVGCSDDAPADCLEPGHSSLCLPRLVPGEIYYVMVAAKDDEHRGLYTVELARGCSADPPIPNDFCHEAEPLEGGVLEPLIVPFDLSGGEEYAEATFDCLIPTAGLENMQNDIWYDWEAPCDGTVWIETYDPSPSAGEQPDTIFIVYEGCDCPVSDLGVVAMSGSCERGSGPGSCARVDARAEQCYKIRLGGDAGGTPAGNLFVEADCPVCPPGPVSFLDPVEGTVDARQSHPPQDPGVLLGIDEFLVEAPSGARIRYCWRVCETADVGVANGISEIIDHGDGTFTLRLDRALTPGAVTTITYLSGDGAETRGLFTAHPANVDGNASVNAEDVTAILNALGGAQPAYGIYSTDIDHSGTLSAADLLRTIDLLNGGDGLPTWGDTPLPQCDEVCCPPPK